MTPGTTSPVGSAAPAASADGAADGFSAAAWDRTAGIRAAVDAHPFVRGLGDGTLPRVRFDDYLRQDALYLREYGRVLAGLAASAPTADEMLFWTASAHRCVAEERSLHARFVDVADDATPSPTCRAYTSFLLAAGAAGSHAVAAAAVLPCFWIYAEVGAALLAEAGGPDGLDGHPFAEWIGDYAAPAFAESAAEARSVVDRLAAAATPAERERMHEAFETAARYEWMFWDAAWRQERWPV